MAIRKVYLDNSATSAIDKEVMNAMIPFMLEVFGNPSSFHSFGRQSRVAIDGARKIIANTLNSHVDEIYFTGCGTESDNIALFGIVNASPLKQKLHVITSKIEHHAVIYSCKELEKRGVDVTYLNVDKNGVVSIDELKKSVKENTVLVSIMHANNEIGTIEPISEIAKEIQIINKNRKFPVYFHTDAVQTAGKLKINVEELGVDLLSLSSHKFSGPKGVGGIFVKKGTLISSVTFGGHHENGLRPGTENIAGIVGFAKALEISDAKIYSETKRISVLKEKLKNGIVEKIPDVVINSPEKFCMENVLNVSFNCIEGEALLLTLDMKGIAISTGSACASGSSEPSHVLSAIGLDAVKAQGAVRFSFGPNNSEEDIDYDLEILPETVKNLRSMSPVWAAQNK
jgi:cysteine desulfurase